MIKNYLVRIDAAFASLANNLVLANIEASLSPGSLFIAFVSYSARVLSSSSNFFYKKNNNN